MLLRYFLLAFLGLSDASSTAGGLRGIQWKATRHLIGDEQYPGSSLLHSGSTKEKCFLLHLGLIIFICLRDGRQSASSTADAEFVASAFCPGNADKKFETGTGHVEGINRGRSIVASTANDGEAKVRGDA